MDVEEGDAIALVERRAGHISQASVDLVERAGRDVARNDRIRHARQTAVPQMHVSSTHFRQCGPEQRATRRQIRLLEFTDLDGHVRRGHDGGKDGRHEDR